MAKEIINKISFLSQEISSNFRDINNLMAEAWIKHELLKSQIEDIKISYKQLSKKSRYDFQEINNE